MRPTPEQLRERIKYDPETGALTWIAIESPVAWQISWNKRCAGKPALNHLSARGYLNGSWKPYTLTAHRVAWAIHHGSWPEHQIDHINGDRTDNRIANLRDVPNKVNAKNTRLDHRNKSGIIGVHMHGQMNKWAAQITIDGKSKHLGIFENIEDAASARKKAEDKYGYHRNHGRVDALP